MTGPINNVNLVCQYRRRKEKKGKKRASDCKVLMQNCESSLKVQNITFFTGEIYEM